MNQQLASSLRREKENSPNSKTIEMYKIKNKMYTFNMTTLSAAEARKNFAEAVKRAQDEPVTIEKHGRREAILISPQLFDRLVEAAEDLEDIEAVEAALADPLPGIPWEQVKADLGWK